MKKLAAIFAMFAAASAAATEPDGYFMLSVIDPGQLPTRTSVIYGARASLVYGACQRLCGIDFGVSGRTFENVYGVQLGGLNIVDLDVAGLQFGVFGNYTAGDMSGLQVGVYNRTRGSACGLSAGGISRACEFEGLQVAVWAQTESFDGVQTGCANVTGSGAGLQLGAYNGSGHRSGRLKSDDAYMGGYDGAQIGVVNAAHGEVSGFQLGVVNYAKSLCGLQVGLLNIIGDGGSHGVLPIANWRF